MNGLHPHRRRHLAFRDGQAIVGATAFFVYVCVELGAGHWAFTALTEADGMSGGTASIWVSSYWAAMTVGRLWFGLAGHRLAPSRVLAASAAGAIMGTVLLTADVAAGLPVLGASLASIFPTLVLVTPSRVGGERAAGAIGWQMAAAGAGGAAGPTAVGTVLERVGVDAYGPVLVVSPSCSLWPSPPSAAQRAPGARVIDDR